MTACSKPLVFGAAFFLSCILSFGQNKMAERRVYYLDATHSMVTPSKLWDPVRKDLMKAIDAIEDESTEIYVVSFGGDMGNELTPLHGFATPDGKKQIIDAIKSWPKPKTNTMTYLNRPLEDFYNSKVVQDKVTYCFLMTDGKDENKDTNVFYNRLGQWGARYGDANVYGFYVMLNTQAKDPKVDSIIEKQNHLWKVESADVNINLIRLDNKALFNVRSDKYIELPISGGVTGHIFQAAFPEDAGLIAKSCAIKEGKLRIEVEVVGDRSAMPEFFSSKLRVELMNGGQFDFLVTDKIVVECRNRKERTLRTPANLKLGKVTHYDSFFFVPSKVATAKQTLTFDFNEDARGDAATYAELRVVDKRGNDINLEEMIVSVNGSRLSKNSFRITPDSCEVEFEIEFSPTAKKKDYKGYLRIADSNLQRINNDICGDSYIDACSWLVHNNKRINPLKLSLLSLLAVLIAAFVLWMGVFKPVLYPRFGSVQKTFNIPGMAPLIIRFKGARMVVVSASPQKKQSGWNRFWTGKVLYKIHPAFTSPIVMRPTRGKILVRADSSIYQVLPNPMDRIGMATIRNNQSGVEISIN